MAPQTPLDEIELDSVFHLYNYDECMPPNAKFLCMFTAQPCDLRPLELSRRLIVYRAGDRDVFFYRDVAAGKDESVFFDGYMIGSADELASWFRLRNPILYMWSEPPTSECAPTSLRAQD